MIVCFTLQGKKQSQLKDVRAEIVERSALKSLSQIIPLKLENVSVHWLMSPLKQLKNRRQSTVFFPFVFFNNYLITE